MYKNKVQYAFGAEKMSLDPLPLLYHTKETDNETDMLFVKKKTCSNKKGILWLMLQMMPFLISFSKT